MSTVFDEVLSSVEDYKDDPHDWCVNCDWPTRKGHAVIRPAPDTDTSNELGFDIHAADVRICRFVLDRFDPWHPPLVLSIRHCRSGPTCQNPEHLEWGVPDRSDRLDPAQAQQVFDSPAESKVIARRFGVSVDTVDHIKAGRTHQATTGHTHTATTDKGTPQGITNKARWGDRDIYPKLVAEMGECCAICGAERECGGKRLAIDHCHTTGAVRGLLCGNCNLAIGLLQDDTDVMANAIAYVTAPPAAHLGFGAVQFTEERTS